MSNVVYADNLDGFAKIEDSALVFFNMPVGFVCVLRTSHRREERDAALRLDRIS